MHEKYPEKYVTLCLFFFLMIYIYFVVFHYPLDLAVTSGTVKGLRAQEKRSTEGTGTQPDYLLNRSDKKN